MSTWESCRPTHWLCNSSLRVDRMEVVFLPEKGRIKSSPDKLNIHFIIMFHKGREENNPRGFASLNSVRTETLISVPWRNCGMWKSAVFSENTRRSRRLISQRCWICTLTPVQVLTQQKLVSFAKTAIKVIKRKKMALTKTKSLVVS